jgi:CRP-like cAMP-binding protein
MSLSVTQSLDLAWLFTDLMTDEKEALGRLMKPATYSSGAIIVQEGAPHSAIWIVGEGSLDVQVKGRKVSSLGVGELFGEQAWLEGAVASASVLAATPVTLWHLSFKDFNTFLDQNLEVQVQILRKLAINLSQRLRQPKA